MVDESASPWLIDDPVLRITARRNLLAIAWFGDLQFAHFMMAVNAGAALRGEYPGKTALLSIIIGGRPPIDSKIREAMSHVARDPLLFPAGTAHIILIPGLIGSAARTFVSTVLLVAKPVTPTRMLPNLDSAAAWLEPKLNAVTPGWTKAEILEVGRRIMAR